jgi:hypothetical protein
MADDEIEQAGVAAVQAGRLDEAQKLLALAVAAVSVARAVFVPPVPGTRLIGVDGLHLDGSCTNNPSAKGGRVLDCNGYFYADSRFAILNHDSGAVAWCIERINDSHLDRKPVTTFGPLIVGTYPAIAADFGGCTQMLPIRTGMYAQIIVKH